MTTNQMSYDLDDSFSGGVLPSFKRYGASGVFFVLQLSRHTLFTGWESVFESSGTHWLSRSAL